MPRRAKFAKGGSLQPKNFLNLTNYFQPLLIYSPKNSPGSAVEIFSAIYLALSIYCVQITVFYISIFRSWIVFRALNPKKKRRAPASLFDPTYWLLDYISAYFNLFCSFIRFRYGSTRGRAQRLLLLLVTLTLPCPSPPFKHPRNLSRWRMPSLVISAALFLGSPD